MPDVHTIGLKPSSAYTDLGEEGSKYDALVIEPVGHSTIFAPNEPKARMERDAVMHAVKRAAEKGTKIFVLSKIVRGESDFVSVGYTPEEAQLLQQYRVDDTSRALREAMKTLLPGIGAGM